MAFLIIAVVFAVQTRRQIPVWSDAMSLWDRAVADQPEYFAGYLGRANAHIGRHDLAAAAANFRTALRLNPMQAQAHNDLAWVLMEQKQYGEAENELRAALARDPGHVRAQVNLGVCAERRGDTAAAEQAYRRAMDMDRNDDLARGNLAALLIRIGRAEEAEPLIDEGLAMQPRSVRLLDLRATLQLSRNLNADAEATCRRIIEIDATNAEAYFRLGVLAVRRGEGQAAIRHYEEAIARNGAHAPYWNNAGCALLDAGRPAEASQKFQKAVELDPNDAPAWNNLGVAMDAIGQRAAAIDAFEHAVFVNPRYALAHERLARLLLADRRYADAIAHLRQAIATVPDLSNAVAAADLLARTLASCPDERARDAAGALELANKLLDATERSVGEVYDTQAMALAALGQFDAAIEAESKAIAALDVQRRSHEVEILKERLALYRNRQAYVAP